MADFGGADLEAFRAETRAWLEANYPPSLKEPMASEDDAPWGGRKTNYSNPDIALWTKRMGEKGWTAPTWPASPWSDASPRRKALRWLSNAVSRAVSATAARWRW